MTQNSTDNLIKRLGAILDDNKGEKIVSINMKPVYGYESIFLIVTALSKTHLKKMAQEIYHEMKRENTLPGSVPTEVDYESGWVILDYGELIVHFFLPEMRELYDLEGLWQKAEIRAWGEAG